MSAFWLTRSAKDDPVSNLLPAANRWWRLPKYVVSIKAIVPKLRRGAPGPPRLLPSQSWRDLGQLVPKVREEFDRMTAYFWLCSSQQPVKALSLARLAPASPHWFIRTGYHGLRSFANFHEGKEVAEKYALLTISGTASARRIKMT